LLSRDRSAKLVTIGPVVYIARIDGMVHPAISVVVHDRAHRAIDWKLFIINIALERKAKDIPVAN